jgi:hypothetical protein
MTDRAGSEMIAGPHVTSGSTLGSSYIQRDIHQTLTPGDDASQEPRRPMMPMLFWLPLIFMSVLFEMATLPTKKAAHSAMTEENPSFGEYHRQGTACLVMAQRVALPVRIIVLQSVAKILKSRARRSGRENSSC